MLKEGLQSNMLTVMFVILDILGCILGVCTNLKRCYTLGIFYSYSLIRYVPYSVVYSPVNYDLTLSIV